jgi:hypothetical protein
MSSIQTTLTTQLFPLAAAVGYCEIAKQIEGAPMEEVIRYLTEELPYRWRDAYLAFSHRRAEISRIQFGAFEYICDDYQSQESRGDVPADRGEDSRVVAVSGISSSTEAARDDYRLKGWIGPTNEVFGTEWDKGHYMAHSLGGAVDRCEINVFVQLRRLNRGWSEAGKRYRKMEGCCVLNPGTFCFSRPLYLDGTCRPTLLEFGVLQAGSVLCVETFDNRPNSSAPREE